MVWYGKQYNNDLSDNIKYSDQPQIYENPPNPQVHKTPAYGRGVDKCLPHGMLTIEW